MSVPALLLVLTSAAFHAGWNRLLHDVEDRVAAMTVAGATSFVLLLPAIVTVPPYRAGALVPLSALLEAIYALALTAAYRRGALSLTYPIGRGTAPLLVTLGGWIVLAQPPRPATVAGAAALGLGLLVIALAGRQPQGNGAIGFALLTACCIASYSLVDARAVQYVSPASYLGVALGLQSVILFAWLRGDVGRLRAELRPGVLIGLGTTAAYLLVLFAFQGANAGRVATLREVSVLIGLLLAREKPGGKAWLGALLIVAGAIAATV